MEMEQGVVFRLASISDSFPQDSPKLHVSHLALSERDKARNPPLLTVFDSSLTTVGQAEVIRGEASKSAAFGLRVEEIRAVEVPSLPRLRVVEDPLGHPACDLPGADGHCGILGLFRPAGHDKQPYRELRVLLADKSFKYYDVTA